MKNIIKTAIISLVGVLAAVSCDKNNPPVFDDANAFAAFDKASASVSESIVTDAVPSEYGDTILIPVTLGSVAGLEAAVTYEVVPDTVVINNEKVWPKEGVNYVLISEGGTLKFDADHRTQYIALCGKYDDRYTGDLSIKITLSSKNVKLGKSKSCKITIADVDHPLSSILGSYTTTSTGGAYKALPYTMTILKDETDDHKVWFNNLFNYPALAATGKMLFYGNVNDDLTSISIPFGQASTFDNGDGILKLYGMNGTFSEIEDVESTGSFSVEIVQKGGTIELVFDKDYGIIVMDDKYYYTYVNPGMVATKQ